MGMIMACDGCGVDVQFLDRFHIQAATLASGSMDVDLCPDCAAPIWALPLGQKLISDAAAARIAEQERRDRLTKEASAS